nr:nascent polypeptide-associated complex subunit alpha, muscle-specific form-like [Aegilops tauschii subsp. strangulata]
MAPALPLLVVSTSSVRPHAAVPRRPRQRRRPSPRLRPRPAFLSLDDACGLAAPLQPPWCASPSRPPEPAASATLSAFRPSWFHAWRHLGPRPSGWGPALSPKLPPGCLRPPPASARLRPRAGSASARPRPAPGAWADSPTLARPASVPPGAGFPARRLEREAVRLACSPIAPADCGSGARRPRLLARRPGRLRLRRQTASPPRPPPRPTAAPAPDGLASSPAAPADYGAGARRPRRLARRPGRLRPRRQTAPQARPPPRPTTAPTPDGLACSPAAPAHYGAGARRPRRLAHRPGRLRPRRQTAPQARPPPRPTTAPTPDGLAGSPAAPADYGPGARRPRRLARLPGRLRPASASPARAGPARRSPAPPARPRVSSAPRRLAAPPTPMPVACPTS